MDRDISLAFCVVYTRTETDGQIQNTGCISTLSRKEKPKISHSMVLHIILMDILLIARIFPRPFGARKNAMQLAKYLHVLYVTIE